MPGEDKVPTKRRDEAKWRTAERNFVLRKWVFADFVVSDLLGSLSLFVLQFFIFPLLLLLFLYFPCLSVLPSIPTYTIKGSGNARCGSRRAPNFVGGGAVFGPVVRSHEQKLQRKVRQLGMKIALSAKLAAGELTIVENLDMENPSTKVAAKVCTFYLDFRWVVFRNLLVFLVLSQNWLCLVGLISNYVIVAYLRLKQAIASLVPAKNCVIVDGQELNEKFDKATSRLTQNDSLISLALWLVVLV